ncbi:MAG: bifunctional homocysteine S-methyltransferase/methylenetetrahydrofolate reductase, partial [candidate division Zixibacteria bacterium]|nr:bifunctional homocysteine S-methyltransferase/methylenetetrahydrofolate reductase [candidate division Zixibacteria bacterium]
MKHSILDHLRHALLVGDGAMGTMLYANGVPLGVCYDEINRSQPHLVCRIHEAYVEAGARLLETNTFGANRISLSKHRMEDRVAEFNRLGVEIARQAANGLAYVAGAAGPVRTPVHAELTEDEIVGAYREQIEALAAAEPDAIILETFLRLDDLLRALNACKTVCNLPVICQLALDLYGHTDDGSPVADAFRTLRAHGADVVGMNCRSGPKGILDALSGIPSEEGLFLSAFPNAGSSVYLDGRFIFAAEPEYFAESALRLREQGVRLIGGCCGTTPDHIRAVAQALENKDVVVRKPSPVVEVHTPPKAREETPPKAPAEPSIVEYVRRRVTVIVELDPPREMDFEPVVKGARVLKAAGADALTMADNSLAVTRISNLAMGRIVQQETGIRPFLHISCRDRNLVGLQSHLLGLHALGIDHVLAVTGDPVKFGDQPGASNVYDVSSFELIRLIKQMNQGVGF